MKLKYFGPSFLLIKALILSKILFLIGSSNHCLLNPLCYCSTLDNSFLDVTCVGLPLPSLPYLPFESIFRLNIIGFNNLHTLVDQALANFSLSSLSIKKSKLSFIYPLAFKPIWSSLTSLDLSYNQLNQLPITSLVNFSFLQWLSLKGNQISDVDSFLNCSKTLNFCVSLKNLILGDNFLIIISDLAFSKLENLQFLELDNNLISKIDGKPFPSSLESLSLAHNLLEKIPIQSFFNLKRLKWIQLKGNLIKQLSNHWPFSIYQLDTLDLSHNLLTTLSQDFFNQFLTNHAKVSAKTKPLIISIKHLLLDFNSIGQLEANIFVNATIRRLSISNNQLSKIVLGAFNGPLENTLAVVDLSYNLLEEYPIALKSLTKLISLSLRGNRIKSIEHDVFEFCFNKLQILDLSDNWLTTVPSNALSTTTSLLKLNLQKNNIQKVDSHSFYPWSKSIHFLSLSKNKLEQISQKSFEQSLNLRELRLAFNNFDHQTNLNFLKPLQSKLAVLELSYSLEKVKDLDVLEQMKCLEFLEIDHNKLKSIPRQVLKNLSSLVHLDLESNEIEELEPNWLKVNKKNDKLRNVLLSSNKIKSIKSQTFNNLQVVNIVFLANQIKTIESFGFANLGSLETLVLASNQIEAIDDQAFYNCSRLVNLLLQKNHLTTFSFNLIQNIKPFQFNMTSEPNYFQDSSLFINISNNNIQKLTYQNIDLKLMTNDFNYNLNFNFTLIKVRTIDLSHNLLSSIDANVFKIICSHLTSLYISFNRLKQLDWLKHCPKLAQIYLDHNQIETLNLPQSHHLRELVILNLSFNLISNLTQTNIFKSMFKLKCLDLSFNLIQIIDPNVWINLTLESLNLSNNLLSNDENAFQNCFSSSSSLKSLDVSGNLFKSVPSSLNSCNELVKLNFANNRIHFLDEKVFQNLNNLQELSLSNNDLKHINSQTFIGLTYLHTLRLNNVSLSTLPILSLNHLTNLELANNLFVNVSSESFNRTNNIKRLDLSKNRLSSIPKNIWHHVPYLAELNLANNSIDAINSISFADLKRLTSLDIRGLNLKKIDLRVLSPLKHLINLKTSTYPKVRYFRLRNLLVNSISLRNVLIDIQETVLSHQIQWAFGTKLKELVITGSKLRRILPDAFLGLYHRPSLILRITGTNITTLPLGLTRYITDVRFITLDFRNNKLNQLKWSVIHFPTSKNILNFNSLDTSENNIQVGGTIMVNDNPLVCTCNLVWLGSWLRKWFRETRKIYRLNYEALLKSYSNVMLTKCKLFSTQINVSKSNIYYQNISLIDLYPSDLNCNSFIYRLIATPWLILFMFTMNFFLKKIIFVSIPNKLWLLDFFFFLTLSQKNKNFLTFCEL